MCSLFINDLDAGAGRMGESTQYTVNNQMVNATLMNIADNPTNVQLPGVYKNETIPRVPIVCTGAHGWEGNGGGLVCWELLLLGWFRRVVVAVFFGGEVPPVPSATPSLTHTPVAPAPSPSVCVCTLQVTISRPCMPP
jgi:hypothetical protein